jgi:hypothetical protein
MIKYSFTFVLLCKHTYYFFDIAPCCTIFLPCPIARNNKTAPEPAWDRNNENNPTPCKGNIKQTYAASSGRKFFQSYFPQGVAITRLCRWAII